ncbi:multicatalytic endopeptidase family protein [Dictyocaulus viviparus]|uniref:proteasome endopeptidase complex n=1 Tax=Dictyocaulus viviparus TaxID=29172 RepID=A0A0D8XKX9_DICVI|nr:multicatalytic endopeptidase family protein [Dictyocaulus viviparus]
MACSQVQEQVLSMELDRGGDFDFSNCIRNMALAKMGGIAPKVRSTGTTIVASTYKGGLVMGADSRATAGNIIADKHCEKVHYLTDSIYACGAGTAADLDQVAKMLSGTLRLMELNTGRKARVITALRHAKQHLFNYQGYVGAYLLIGGVDPTGPHLYECSANGTTMAKPFAAQGSGSYAAISVLERDFKPDMTASAINSAKLLEDDAVNLVQRALHAGMHADNASGNSLNLVIMRPGKTEFRGPIIPDFCKKPEPVDLSYKFKPGSTKVLKRKTIKFDIIESMDVSH